MSNSLPFDLLLDASGLACPMPLLKTKLALKNLQAGEVLKVVATDAGSWRDIPKFAALASHELIASAEVDSQYLFWIRKGV